MCYKRADCTKSNTVYPHPSPGLPRPNFLLQNVKVTLRPISQISMPFADD